MSFARRARASSLMSMPRQREVDDTLVVQVLHDINYVKIAW